MFTNSENIWLSQNNYQTTTLNGPDQCLHVYSVTVIFLYY